MLDVLVLVLAGLFVVGVVTARYRRADRERSSRNLVLAALAPVVGGTVSREQVLSGRYRDYDVQVSLRTADPAPPDLPGGESSERSDVEVVRVRLVGAPGAQPWAVWRHLTPTGSTTWHFARPDGSDLLPFLGPLTRLAGAPQADPDLPDRLSAAGVLDALAALGPPTGDSFPHVRFMPLPGPVALDRLRTAGRDLPPSALEEWLRLRPSLEVEVERADEADPSPDRFRSILDTAIGIAEINARANPAEPAPA